MKQDLIPVGESKLNGHYYPSLDMYGVRLPKDDIVPFYDQNWNFMSSSGLSSFLKVLRIPEAYFNRLTAATKVACLSEASADLKEDVMLLSKNTKVEYAAPARYDDSVYAVDPVEYVGLTKFDADTFRIKQIDCRNGRLYMVAAINKLVKDEYIPSVQLNLPLFYASHFEFSAGLYKVKCTNGLMDTISASTMKVSFVPDQGSLGISDTLRSMLKVAQVRGAGYMRLIERLKMEAVDASHVRGLIDHPAFKRAFAGAPVASLKKHASLLLTSSEVPFGSPTSIHSWYDVMDTLTYYAARGGEDTKKRQKAESAIFGYFAKNFDYEMSMNASGAHAVVEEALA